MQSMPRGSIYSNCGHITRCVGRTRVRWMSVKCWCPTWIRHRSVNFQRVFMFPVHTRIIVITKCDHLYQQQQMILSIYNLERINKRCCYLHTKLVSLHSLIFLLTHLHNEHIDLNNTIFGSHSASECSLIRCICTECRVFFAQH